MGLLKVNKLSHRFQDKILFDKSSFNLYKGEHMGVVGENGVGKSTLLKILLGEILADEGEISWQNNISIGYIEQHLKIKKDMTVLEYLKLAFEEEYKIEKELNKLYEKMAVNYDEKILNKVSKYQEELENSDFYSISENIDKIIVGLGLDSLGLDKNLSQLSGGQQTKVILAKLLLEKSDVLLLDEPTNFLDDNHIEWLVEYLNSYSNSFIVISHNLSFLKRITNCILDIEFQDIKKYHGSYDEYLKLKEEYKKNYIKSYNLQQVKIKRTEEFIRKNKAGVNSKIARGRQKHLDRLERITEPSFTKKPNFNFNLDRGNPLADIEVKNLKIGYDYQLLPELNLKINSTEKIVITGFNGIGKSTLLKTMIGEIDKISGNIKYSRDINIGYYEQELNWEDDNLTALEIVSDSYPNLKIENIRRELSRFGIDSEDLDQPINTLSGGEQSKVKLCKLALKPYNFIIMDEPTNHLDKETKDVLKKALINFKGTIILVSHEKEFYRNWIDRVYNIG